MKTTMFAINETTVSADARWTALFNVRVGDTVIVGQDGRLKDCKVTKTTPVYIFVDFGGIIKVRRNGERTNPAYWWSRNSIVGVKT